MAICDPPMIYLWGGIPETVLPQKKPRKTKADLFPLDNLKLSTILKLQRMSVTG